MAGTVVIGCADQSLAYELRAQLSEAAEVEVVGVGETTGELADLVLQHDPSIVLVHDLLGPEPVHQVVRDLSLRRPASVSIVVTSDEDPEVLAAAMDAGARGVLSYPLSFADVQQRVNTALDWSRHMQSLLLSASADGGSARGRAVVVAVAGTKGGVGATTIATHIAWDVRREIPDHKVLVVDLDLEKGDVSSLIEARARTSVADLAKVAQDLSVRTVADAVFQHESGIHLLLPPDDVRDVEWVTPTAIRQIVGLLRQQYDLVIVDVGAHVTPVQAAVVEIADEVVAVITPDLLSIRALRRNLRWWESLQVRKPESVHVLLNKSSRQDEVQPETVRRLTPGVMLSTVVQDMGHKLETAMNSRAPELVTDVGWWRTLRSVGREVGVARTAAPVADPAGAGVAATEARAKRAPGRRQKASDAGSASVELVALLPMIFLVCAILWQLGLTGLTYVWTGYGASEAARAVQLGQSSADVRAATLDAFPSGLRDDVDIRVASPLPSSVDVSVRIPAVVPGLISTPWTAKVEREVVLEP